ncbi:MauE/DoxX family redox-associated membrane protein [Streptomyces tardus]|uniref:MauE/DoxX family redox-associated membrane protein n=1 Tax=Streptomyces tardus TaxID=2780544 RepID=UPI0027E3BEE1|nr:MauE/DoxX family redox-associated membrane protein [Streptomyces tardus]
MTSLLGTVTTAVVLLVLLAGCAAHLSRPAALPDALHAHGLVPERAVRLAAVAATLAEGVLGTALVASLLLRQRTALTAALAATALLFVCYALYTRHALATGRGGPCGCSRTEVPLSGWVVGRAWVFAALALGGAVLAAGPGNPPEGAAETAVAALVAVTLAVLLWVLPAAMAQPAAGSAPARRSVAPDPHARNGVPHTPHVPHNAPHARNVTTVTAMPTVRGGHRAWTS